MLEDFRLKVFLKVAETGSFTLASRELGITQSAASQNITTLEKTLGARLFVRERGDISLTAEGKIFKEYAEKILYWYDAADAMFGSKGRMTMNRPVRISAVPVLADYLVSRALTVLCAFHKDTGFIVESQADKIPRSMFNVPEDASDEVPGTHFGSPEDADVELTVSPSPETMDFEGESRLIGVMDAVVIASPSNRSVEFDPDSPNKPFSTLAGIHVSNRFAVWRDYMRFLQPDILARVIVDSVSIESIKTLVANSDTIVGVVPYIAARREIMAGTLVQLPVQLPDLSFDIHFNPLPEFSGKTICTLLSDSLRSAAAR